MAEISYNKRTAPTTNGEATRIEATRIEARFIPRHFRYKLWSRSEEWFCICEIGQKVR